MKRWAAAALACAALAVQASPALRLADARPSAALRLEPIDAQGAKLARAPLRPNQIGISRRDDVAAQAALTGSRLAWQAAEQGVAARMSVVSSGAAGLRVGLRFAALPDALEIRVAERDSSGELSVVDVATGAEMRKLARGRFPLEHWTTATAGEEQVIELRMPRPPRDGELDVEVFDVSHLFQLATQPVRPLLDYACHVEVSCSGNADAIADESAVAVMQFVSGGDSFVCTGSLLADTAGSGTPLFASANHCIGSQADASTLTTLWFYYTPACGAAAQLATRLTGGAALLMAHRDSDFSLMRLAHSPPAGVRFLSWDPTPLDLGQQVFGVHQPGGSYQRYVAGTFAGIVHVTDDSNVEFANPFNAIVVSQGIIEGGSSGSPLLTAPDVFHGTLYGGPDSNACGATDNAVVYSDFAVAYPLASGFLAGPSTHDDHGDSAATATALASDASIVAQINTTSDVDWFRFDFDAPGTWTISSFNAVSDEGLDVRADVFAADGVTLVDSNDDRSPSDFNFSMRRAIAGPSTFYVRVSAQSGQTGSYGLSSTFDRPDEYGNDPTAAAALSPNAVVGGYLNSGLDQDWFRITFDGPGTFHASTLGYVDTMGTLYASDTTTVVADNDDENSPNTNFGFTVAIPAAGTYYLKIVGFDGDKGPYTLVTTFTGPGQPVDYTDLWWASPAGSESGWGINLNHQSDTIFATLFSYGADGRDLWVVASGLARDSSGNYSGPLYRTSGPSFDSPAWSAVTVATVGSMALSFSSANRGTLTYSIDGTAVTKTIERQVFRTPPTCAFTASPRVAATNYQDLWWNPDESGWGINLTQQGALMFATLFVYAPDHRPMWLVASSLALQRDGSFAGDLYRTTGPPFNAAPWTQISATPVGSMSLAFSNGTAGTLTYTFNGTRVAKPIQRQVFGVMPTICH